MKGNPNSGLPITISASLLSADFLNLQDEITLCEAAGIRSFHLDVMDGHLAPNISFGPPIIHHIRKATTQYLDAHLMIDNPWLYLDEFINCRVNAISLHVESYGLEPVHTPTIKSTPRKTTSINESQLKTDLTYIQTHQIHAGLTINPQTPLSVIAPFLPICDSVLIMSVNPGFSGQQFQPSVLTKIADLRKIFSKSIKIDGGINHQTAPQVISAGADTLITASYLFSSPDYQKAYQSLIPE